LPTLLKKNLPCQKFSILQYCIKINQNLQLMIKNKAKCLLCKEIIESYHLYDYVTCKCGEISISGGQHKFEALAKNWDHFVRFDDNGNEFKPKIIDKDTDIDTETNIAVQTPDELTQILLDLAKSGEDNSLPVWFYQICSAIFLLNEKISTKNERKDLTDIFFSIEKMAEHIEHMPDHAKCQPATQNDVLSVLNLLKNMKM